MNPKEKLARYAETVRLFSVALSLSRLYSEGHPTAQTAVGNFFNHLRQALKSEGSISLGFTEARLLVNNQSLDSKMTGVDQLLKEFRALHVNRLVLELGITENEISRFFKLLTKSPTPTGFKKSFDQARFRRIRLSGRYKAVEDEEEEEVSGVGTGLGTGEEAGGGEGIGEGGGLGEGGGFAQGEILTGDFTESAAPKPAYEVKPKDETLQPDTFGGIDLTPEGLAEIRHLRERFQEEVARKVEEVTHKVEEKLAAADREKRLVLAEKERVDSIIRNLGEGLVVLDNDGKIQLMNPAAEKLLGLSQEQGRGAPIDQFLKEEHLLALAKGPLRDQGDRVTKEIEVKSVDEEARRILQASSAVVENEDGKTVGMVSILSDITKQKKLDEMKSAFVAQVSHDLRTPLFAIEQSLHLLLEKEPLEITPERQQFLSITQRNITRLSRLVNDLLDVAKLEAGQMRLRKVSFKICDLIHHAAETVRGWAGNRDVKIEERYPQKDLEVEADPDRLTQVMTNLMGNAVKFTPSGGTITLEVDPNHMDAEISQQPCVAVSVQDTGIGIAKEDQQRIFRKFEQVSLATPQEVSNTGLGLTIVKEIVELHGGKIWVESREGEGSRFTFVIPMRLNSSAET